MRFYGTGVYNLPEWVRWILEKSLPALRAEEALQRADAMRAAGAIKEDYKGWLDRKEMMSRPLQEPIVPYILPRSEPWFKAHGIPYKLMPQED